MEGYTEENFGTGERPAGFDSDEDGIADDWELANGLNPNDASDAALYTIDSDRQWYSNLEVYLNSLVEHIMQAGNCDAQSSVDEYYPVYQKPAGISSVSNSPVKSIEYYTIDGKRIAQPTKGICLQRQTMADGSVKTSKVVF